VGGQLPERPSRAGRHRPFQITVDDPGEFRRAAAQLGKESRTCSSTSGWTSKLALLQPRGWAGP
jgi:hypothetical protein